jgi:HAD superfamily hydrolase (TIGR01450 family)
MRRVSDRGEFGLSGSKEPLSEIFDVALLDLDGVVYVGREAVPKAAEALRDARAAGMRLAFVTNNAARSPQAVAEHLTELGIAARADEVVTSSQAAAHYLADRLPPGARVLVVGTTGLQEALLERGLTPVMRAEDGIAAVVQGYSPTLDWPQLAEGAVAIGRGLPWVATNMDPTVPSPRGPLPGNGSLVAALRHATGAEPIVTGKPEPTMHRESVQRSGAQRPLVVGDRLDTDVEGANAVGCASLLVLTGVTSPRDLLRANPRQRPSYLGADLEALLTTHPGVIDDGDAASCAGWTARCADAEVTLTHAGWHGDGDVNSEPLDALRALCVASWRLVDADADADADADRPTNGGAAPAPVIAAGDEQSQSALERLGLARA